MEGQQGDHWLDGLAASRITGLDGRPALSTERNQLGQLQCTLRCRRPEASSTAVAQLLLGAFAEATTSAARSKEALQLPRSLEITILSEATAAPDQQQCGAAAQAEEAERRQEPGAAAASAAAGGEADGPGELVVQFTATDPAAEAQVEEAARLFEAYLQYQIKAAKSDLHSRMRQRLGALRQRLALTKFDQ